MRRWHVLTLSTCLALGMGFGWAAAQQRSTPPALSAQDYADITQLFGRYAQGTDFMDGPMWLSVFTDDAEFRPSETQVIVGMKALTDWRYKNFSARKPGQRTRHWNSSWVITPTGGGGATGRVYWMGVNASGPQPVTAGSGWYEDVYVRTPAGWRIKQRHAKSDATPRATQ